MQKLYRDPPPGCLRLFIIVILLCSIAIIVLSSCSTIKTVPVVEYHDRIEYRDRTVIDSTYIRDSIYVKEKGDTVFYTVYKYIDRIRIRNDTSYVHQYDSIPYPVEIIQEVNRLTSLQKKQIWGFWILSIIISIVSIYKLRKYILKWIQLR